MSKNKLEELKNSISTKSPKQMRTLRNQLNNRITSFEGELRFGKNLAKLSESHTLFGLDLKDCQELLKLTQQELRTAKKADE